MIFCGFHTVFLTSNNYYLFSEWDFLFFHLLLQRDPCVFLLFLFLITCAFSKCSTKWGIPIYFFRTVKRIFGGKSKYRVYVCLPVKRCTMHDARCTIIAELVVFVLRGEGFHFHFHFHFFNCRALCMNQVTLSTRNKHQKTLTRIEALAFNPPVRSYVGIIRSLFLEELREAECSRRKLPGRLCQGHSLITVPRL